MPTITGTAFEDYVWSNWWLRNFPTSDWNREPQVRLAGSYKVDFVAYRGNERAIGDAKDKASLTFQDVGGREGRVLYADERAAVRMQGDRAGTRRGQFACDLFQSDWLLPDGSPNAIGRE